MIENFEKTRKKEQNRFVILRDAGMGVVIILVGLFFFGRAWVALDLNNRYPPDDLDKWFVHINYHEKQASDDSSKNRRKSLKQFFKPYLEKYPVWSNHIMEYYACDYHLIKQVEFYGAR